MYNVSMPKKQVNQEFLRMALAGYEAAKLKIDEKIREVQALLGGPGKRTYTKRSAVVEEPATPTRRKRKRRKMSAEARKRIGDATRKRWAELRKVKKKNS